MKKKITRYSQIVVPAGVDVAIGMNQKDLNRLVGEVMKSREMKPSAYMTVLMEKDRVLICTKLGIIVCDKRLNTSRVLIATNPQEYHPGKKVLPASMRCR